MALLGDIARKTPLGAGGIFAAPAGVRAVMGLALLRRGDAAGAGARDL